MKKQKEDQNELFNALFKEDEKLSKEQLAKAKELFQRKPLPEDEQKAVHKIQEHQALLNSRRIELITKALGTEKISEDDEIKEHFSGLEQTYSEMTDRSDETDLSFEDCELPPPGDLVSRVYPGRQNNGSPLVFTFSSTNVSGDDDNISYSSPDPDEGKAEINGSQFFVKSQSNNDALLSTHKPVESTATLHIYLPPRFRALHFSELVVKAHLQGSYSGSTLDRAPFGGDRHIYAWLKLDISSWDDGSNDWVLKKSVKVNVMEPPRTRYDRFVQYSHISDTSFSETLEARTDVINNNPQTDILVSVTAGTEALAPPPSCSGARFMHGFSDINRANARLSAILCAADIGIERTARKLPDERRYPRLDLIEL